MSHRCRYSRLCWTGIWATWSSWRYPFSLQGAWTWWPLKVHSNSTYYMILCLLYLYVLSLTISILLSTTPGHILPLFAHKHNIRSYCTDVSKGISQHIPLEQASAVNCVFPPVFVVLHFLSNTKCIAHRQPEQESEMKLVKVLLIPILLFSQSYRCLKRNSADKT